MAVSLISKSEDLFKSKNKTLVNTTNTVGVMGKGIALSFKIKFPEMYADYQTRCKEGRHVIGEPYLYPSSVCPWIINFPTKQHWKNPSQVEWIEKGLLYLDSHYQAWQLESLAIPMLGCSNGGLDPAIVLPIMQSHLSSWGIPVEIYI
jgi:O-acetyl-ADP-ribose deacetylase (regulator of RNase III)